MTLYQGSRTTVEINRKSGRVRVWSAATGKLIEEFFILTARSHLSLFGLSAFMSSPPPVPVVPAWALV